MPYVPTIPPGVPAIELSDNSRTVLAKRYLRRGINGEELETIDEMFLRVAYNVAKPDGDWCPAADADKVVEKTTTEFYTMLTEKKFFPNSPTFTGAGTPLGQLAACFVLPIVDDMGRDPAGIMSTLRNAALIQQTGGGNGFSFSNLRQKGAFVKSSGGTSTGPIGFMKVYDQAFGMIAQGGTRRGANMAVLRVDHPDIREFVTCKATENSITNFNISVGITDAFMKAVRDDTDFALIAPHTQEEIERVQARELFDLIVKYAHHNGEPGVLFLDAANRQNPVPHLYQLESTNPCGEQWLGPYENCCLGSINLAKHLLPGGKLDWALLEKTCRSATHFLDNVVEANAYVPHVPQLRKAALQCRRIGLGIMGLADAMYHVGVRYGAAEAEEFAGQVMEFVRYHCMLTSIQLADERGAFPASEGSLFDKNNLRFTVPKPLNGEHKLDFGQPSCNWDDLVAKLKATGIRNACLTTIAPTGTIATVAGCEGYGCEPVFALAYYRHVNDNGKDLVLTYTSPAFEAALDAAGISGDKKKDIIDQVVAKGSCQGISELPAHIRETFVVSSDISPKEHVRMQASLQAFVDNSLSKTCNLPAQATEADVAKCYMMAWELGCKGLTVYVTGSRSIVVLETKEELEKKNKADADAAVDDLAPVADLEPEPVADNHTMVSLGQKKPRAKRLVGCTHMINTPVGKAFVTINEDQDQPFEAFINTAKAGSETAAVSEAFGRLISYILRVASPVAPRKRLEEVMNQLMGIGGRRAMGFGRNRVLSLPDGVAQAIAGYLESSTPGDVAGDLQALRSSLAKEPKQDAAPAASKAFKTKIGDLCPDCGDSALINEEGCKKCYSCGYSEC